MPSLTQTLLLFVGLFFTTSAQFQFFEQMFNGGGQQQQQQQPQNVPSDSNWYRQNYEAGMYTLQMGYSYLLTYEKPTAQTTSALIPSPASISHIIARAHTRIRKIRSS